MAEKKVALIGCGIIGAGLAEATSIYALFIALLLIFS